MKLRQVLGSVLIAAAAGVFTGCETHDYNTLEPLGNVIVEGDYPTKMKAPEDGQVSVYDVNSDKTIWNGAIRKGQMLVLDPKTKQLTLDGMACNMQDLGGGHTLKIMYAPAKPE
jgi:hypothetical protein